MWEDPALAMGSQGRPLWSTVCHFSWELTDKKQIIMQRFDKKSITVFYPVQCAPVYNALPIFNPNIQGKKSFILIN